MSKQWLCSILAIGLLVLSSCAASLPAGDSGSVTLIPFFNEEFGISGVVPVTCTESAPGNFECLDLAPDGSWAAIIQQAYPGPLDELEALVLDQISLDQLPASAGSYKGRAFDWDLYTLQAQIWEVGPQPMRIELALAHEGPASYVVALATPPETYDAHPELFDTIFTHAVYGLVPWQ